jgi:hypothetical protein
VFHGYSKPGTEFGILNLEFGKPLCPADISPRGRTLKTNSVNRLGVLDFGT